MFPGGNVIRVTPTVDTSAYSANDTFFNATEIPNAVSSRGGVSKLVGISAVSVDAEIVVCELLFHQTGGINLGTLNTAPDISDANFLSLNILGVHSMQAADWISNHSSTDSEASIYSNALTQADQSPLGMLLKADEGSTSVYVSAIAGTTNNFAAATDLQLIFHLEYLG
jgi:hypothetical protein